MLLNILLKQLLHHNLNIPQYSRELENLFLRDNHHLSNLANRTLMCGYMWAIPILNSFALHFLVHLLLNYLHHQKIILFHCFHQFVCFYLLSQIHYHLISMFLLHPLHLMILLHPQPPPARPRFHPLPRFPHHQQSHWQGYPLAGLPWTLPLRPPSCS